MALSLATGMEGIFVISLSSENANAELMLVESVGNKCSFSFQLSQVFIQLSLCFSLQLARHLLSLFKFKL